jgi:cytochrome c peroxidase
MTIFFSQQFSNCNACHQLNARPNAKHETFSDYRYHNIGVPENKQLREANKLGAGYQDKGLFHNPDINDESLAGKFKTPSLRNVAVTGPYMHNGVFQDLRTVVSFYNKYNSKSPQRQIDPETGETWAKPEVPENISLQELREGPALDDRRIDALVAFMKILTDKRFEHLLPKDTSQQN